MAMLSEYLAWLAGSEDFDLWTGEPVLSCGWCAKEYPASAVITFPDFRLCASCTQAGVEPLMRYSVRWYLQ